MLPRARGGALLLLAIIGLLPLMLFVGGVLYLYDSQQQSELQARIQEEARDAANAVARTVHEQTGQLLGLVSAVELDRGDIQTFRLEATRLQELHPEWVGLTLTDERQQVMNLRMAPEAPLPEISNLESLRGVFESGKPDVGNVNAVGNVSLRVPVIRSGRVKYTLVAAVRATFFATMLERYGLPEGWRATILDGKDEVIGRAPAGQAVVDATAWSASAPIPSTVWRVAVDAPTSMIEDTLRSTRYILWFGALFAALAAITFSTFVNRAWADHRDRGRLIAANQELREVASGRETLLREVYHRVHNNLQLIDAFLSLRTSRSRNEEVRDLARDLRDRIQAVALVHRQLMVSKDPGTVDLGPFVTELCRNLARSSGAEARGIPVETETEQAIVDIETALPVGVLITELLAGSLRLSFPPGKSGSIRVSLRKGGDGSVILILADNGTLPDEDLPPDSRAALGNRIIQALVGQLHGRISVTTNHGTRTEVVLPPPADATATSVTSP
jgi:two-component sensor histidine kinase